MKKLAHDTRLLGSPTSPLSGTNRIPPRFPLSPVSLVTYLVGLELFADAWHRSKAKLMGALVRRSSNVPVDPFPSCHLPPEILEMIVAHLKYDTPTLKACVATCFSWYNIAAPHLHRTLTLVLRERNSIKRWKRPSNPLPILFKLGLLPFVRDLEFEGSLVLGIWDGPAAFSSKNMRFFRAMVNLQKLTIAGLDFSKFPRGLGEQLGCFAPTLRSVALSRPDGTRRQILDFFRLFPKLDDVKISDYDTIQIGYRALDGQLAPVGGGLRGRLTLNVFGEEGLLEDMVIAFGGMRFSSMDLRQARGMQFLFKNCAETLEKLRIYPEDLYFPSYRIFDPGKRVS